MEGRDTDRLLRAGVAALERGAKAQEELLVLARAETGGMVQAELGPPICPHCGKVNPTVSQVNTDGEGTLGDFVLAGECQGCHHVGYYVPEGWLCFATSAEIADYQNDRRAG